jgi:diguanylate cyclase (GGDEF)-like protein
VLRRIKLPADLLAHFSLTRQFILLGALGVFIPVLTIGLSLRTSYLLALHDKETQTKSLVESAVSWTEAYVALAKQGRMSAGEAQADALAALAAARFDDGDYYFVLSYKGASEFLPPKEREAVEAQLDKDSHHRSSFNQKGDKVAALGMLEGAIEGKPEFVQYEYKKPGSTLPLPKIAYGMAVPEWGWVVGTGVYLDDLQTDFFDQLLHLARFFLPLIFCFLVLILMMIRTFNLTMERHRTAQMLEAKNAVLREMSATDGLTGAANRRAFDAHLAVELERLKTIGAGLALIMIDVDHFKSYNDFHGHPLGDARLRELVTLIRSKLRDNYDLLARYGGEEFAVIMSNISYEQAVAAAERVRLGVAQAKAPHGGPGAGPYVTISVGVAVVKPDQDITPSILIQQADQALYRAKKSGRNKVDFGFA